MLKGKANVIIVLQYFYLVQVFGTGMLQNFQEMKVMEEVGYGFFLWLGGLVGFAYVMQNMLSRATLLKKASYIMPFGYVSIVVSSICDIIVFGVDFDWLSGIGMVMASVGLVSQLIVGEQ
jgi:drug/metabolite transporter (DMT)-like permease